MQERDNGQRRDDKQDRAGVDLTQIDEAIARIREKLASCSASTPKTDVNVATAALRGKLIATVICLLVSIFAMVWSSYAWFTASIASSNQITPGFVHVEYVDLSTLGADGGFAGTELDPIRILPGYTEEHEVYASNVGSVSLYVRARAVATITLAQRYAEHEAEVDLSLVAFNFNEAYWQKHGDYYYHTAVLHGGESTPEFFSEIKFSEAMGNIYKGSTIRVKVIFEVVQATNNGSNALEAVGWTTVAEGGASA